MKQQLHILLIDDHPMTIEGYKAILENMFEKPVISEAYTVEESLERIRRQPDILPFDLAFVDINLPAARDAAIHSGEGVALQLKKKFPQTKIIVPTMFSQGERIRYIIKTVNPDALLLKNDFTSSEIKNAVESVLNGETYYSKGAKQALKADDLGLDRHDLGILYCLSKQIKVKDMPEHIPLSLRAIEERKSILMLKLDVPPRDNQLLVIKAREKGLL
ncbi:MULTISPECIES: response regulator transcription factor [unclassified Chryseobacterium]|uniref:response regulator n=1 Tax=unclassified Chryseobacterium TaxID=2593645 RepID=UPI000D3B3C2A|nr:MULTISPECIES: response regulator transcription factor [unclassified Chryseobacterium]PTT76545.1 DNA-binding response regulator [Chryseobacterium sp. HMWF001]PVV55570.1 DNA-binding response regulator [Chryseobacterium sp. HMWF035]